MKKLVFIILLIVILIFTSCLPQINVKNESKESRQNSMTTSSQESNSPIKNSYEQDVSTRTGETYEELMTTMNVDNNSAKMDANTLSKICQRVGGLSMMKPTGYEFEDVKKVPFDKLNWYFRSAAYDYPFFEKISEENQRLQAGPLYLNYEQTMEIIKNEFEVDYFPFKVSDKQKLKVDISAGPDPHCDILKTLKKGDTITVQANVLEVEKATISNMDVFIKMEYVFKLRDKGNVVPMSARRI